MRIFFPYDNRAEVVCLLGIRQFAVNPVDDITCVFGHVEGNRRDVRVTAGTVYLVLSVLVFQRAQIS